MILDGANGSIAKEGYSAHGALDAYEAWNGYAEAVEPNSQARCPQNVTQVYAQIATDGTTLGEIFDEDELREVDNMFYLDAGITKSAVKNIRAGKTVSGISLFPVFTAESGELKQNSLGAVAFAVSGEAFGGGSTLADVAVCKVFPDGTALEYKEAGASPADGDVHGNGGGRLNALRPLRLGKEIYNHALISPTTAITTSTRHSEIARNPQNARAAARADSLRRRRRRLRRRPQRGGAPGARSSAAHRAQEEITTNRRSFRSPAVCAQASTNDA